MSELQVSGCLDLRAENKNGKTIISDCFFTSPYKLAKPFYNEGEFSQDAYTEIMVMCASPGVLSGDTYNMRFDFSENTKTIITEQSYRKLYNTNKISKQDTVIQLGENASLYYIPYPVIPFAGSRFNSKTEIKLRQSSRLIYGDIMSCGRQGMGEQFAFKELTSRTAVYIDECLNFLDNNYMINDDSEHSMDFSGMGFFEAYSCQGVFVLYGFNDFSLESISVPVGLEAAVSKSSSDGLTVRMLGNSANELHNFASNLFLPLFKADK